ncbi:hypothetical protein [Weissella confusa]|uniref:Uncharacterized protein n=1 Tax=Weissella confusa TaxID=1583 RepID=A0A4Z0RVZ0_WEICO|nr:hypothetical protein [Weissella confusa]TGE72109.1 hypothetical protein C6P11_06605 [Weissella confusa]
MVRYVVLFAKAVAVSVIFWFVVPDVTMNSKFLSEVIPNWLSAIGTVGAVVLSLYFSYSGKSVDFKPEITMTISKKSDGYNCFGISIELYGFNNGKGGDAVRKITYVLSDKGRKDYNFMLYNEDVLEINPESYVSLNRNFSTSDLQWSGYVLGDLQYITVIIETYRRQKYVLKVKPVIEMTSEIGVVEEAADRDLYTARDIFGSRLTLRMIDGQATIRLIKSHFDRDDISDGQAMIQWRFPKADAELLVSTYAKELKNAYQ